MPVYPILDMFEFNIMRLLVASPQAVIIHFTKADGTQRDMVATLNESLIPPEAVNKDSQEKTTRKENPAVCTVWDLEKKAWRSFKWASVKAYTWGGAVNKELTNDSQQK